ncbi:MAG: CO dehydrogenase/CO-methylating acetyl-CoA synthase complex subunit beta [Promethearchaeota archaeon]
MSFEDLPVAVGVVFEGERIRKGDMQVELGGPKIEKKFELVVTRKMNEIEDGKLEIIGPDLKDLKEGESHPLGILIEVAGKEVEEDLEGVLERHVHEYTNFIEGVMHLNQRYDIWIRISKKSFQKGLNTFKLMGQVYERLYKSELPIIEKIQVTFITDADKIAEHYDKAITRYDERDARARGLKDEDVDVFYGCTLCQSFAPTHCCTITAQRYANCGAISWFDGRAAARVDPKGPLFAIEKGKTIDEYKGQYEGVNQAYKEKTLGAVTDVCLYSAFEKPHTSCGCFEAIAFVIPEVDGLGLVHRDYKGSAVNGLPFSTMADSTAGGRQIPGFHGVSIEYMRSPKFLQVDGGWERIVWLPKAIKDRVYDFMPENLRDIIPTENDVSSVEELKAYLKDHNHPVVERWVDVGGAARLEEEERHEEITPTAQQTQPFMMPGQMMTTVPATGGSPGFQIIFKNAKIYAEKVIIKRLDQKEKK